MNKSQYVRPFDKLNDMKEDARGLLVRIASLHSHCSHAEEFGLYSSDHSAVAHAFRCAAELYVALEDTEENASFYQDFDRWERRSKEEAAKALRDRIHDAESKSKA
jgi:hypothetical protein